MALYNLFEVALARLLLPLVAYFRTDTVAVFMFTAGGWGVAVADAILNNLLLQKLPQYVPDIDPQSILSVGAGGIKNAYQGEVLRGVQQAYLDGLHGSWALGIVAFGVTFLWALVPKWPGKLLPPSGEKQDAQANEEDESDRYARKVN